MLKIKPKSFFLLLGLFLFCTCIDPYYPRLDRYKSILTVDAQITDDNSSNFVKLSRSFNDLNNSPEMVDDALVSITDGENISYSLINEGNGIYLTDASLHGKVGEKYTLHISTHEGEEYQSETCLMNPVNSIDSVFYIKGQKLNSRGTDYEDGIFIYVASKIAGDEYYRWSYDETWKFRVPYPKKFNYIDSKHIPRVERIKETCWRNRKSDENIVYSGIQGADDKIINEPVLFIPATKSDRLLIEYSIMVKQYSISEKDYEFWSNLNKAGEGGGDIFAAQPFPVVSNVHNVKNNDEKVLGYFQVSAVRQMRKFIVNSAIRKLNLPFYRYDCQRIAIGPGDYPDGFTSAGYSFADIISGFSDKMGYEFIEPEYDEFNNLAKLVFTKIECADCEVVGTSTKPDFWIDFK